jgi:hypothetical protein
MLVKQISVFVENKPGQAHKPIKALSDAGIILDAVSVSGTTDYGILRIITNDSKRALMVLQEAGCTANTTDLIGITIEETSTEWSYILEIFALENINIEYFYSYIPRAGKQVITLFKVASPTEVITKLKAHNINFVD